MVGQIKLMKTRWYPRPHNYDLQYAHGLESAVANQHTIIPLVMNDEGLGAPTAYEAHPENAAFVEAAEPNCFTNSRVDFVVADLTFSLTKAFEATDSLVALRIGFMPIFMSFIGDYTAIDELSTAEIQDVLEMQTESTDNQGFPLYNNVDMKITTAALAVLPANVPGLT